MTSLNDEMDAQLIKDEDPIQLAGIDEVRAALSAELALLDGLIDVARDAAAAQSPPVSDFLERYWVTPLEQDRAATDGWLGDLATDQQQVLDAASEELLLVRAFRRLARGLGAEFLDKQSLQAALASYDEDFRTEAEGKRSILEAF